MNSPKYSNDECETLLDVLNHKFIYNTLVKLYNEENIERMSYERQLSGKIDLFQIEDFIIKVFKNKELLRRFFDRLRSKYSRLPHWTFTQEQAFITLTALYYFGTELCLKPFTKTIEEINVEINDILEFDYWLWEHSHQMRRNILLDKNIPLIDSDWYEVTDFINNDEILDNVDIIFHKWESTDNLPFYALMTESDEGLYWDELDNFYIKLSNRNELLDSFWLPVSLSSLRKAVVTNNHIYFKTYDFEYFFDETWDILKDSFWNDIDEILWLESLWDKEIALVASNGCNSSYYININTKEILFAKKNGIAQWVINKLSIKEVFYWDNIYYQAESDWDIFLVDNEWNILSWDDWEPAFNIIWGVLISRKASEVKK